ncbi:g4125 [Coccomyxa elongata]
MHVCFGNVDAQRLISACLFAASKVEESPVRTNDLLNAVRYVTSPRDSSALAVAFPSLLVSDASASGTTAETHQPDGIANGSLEQVPRPGFLAGDEYYAAKDQLIMDEQILLRVLRFEISVQHAHKYLLNMCHVLRCSQPLAQMALCLVNDSLFRTGLSLDHSPAEVAAGALHAASLLLGVARELPYKGQLCWWDALGFSLTTVEKVGHALLDAILQQHMALP